MPSASVWSGSDILGRLGHLARPSTPEAIRNEIASAAFEAPSCRPRTVGLLDPGLHRLSSGAEPLDTDPFVIHARAQKYPGLRAVDPPLNGGSEVAQASRLAGSGWWH
jgi:hypothetical protein